MYRTYRTNRDATVSPVRETTGALMVLSRRRTGKANRGAAVACGAPPAYSCGMGWEESFSRNPTPPRTLRIGSHIRIRTRWPHGPGVEHRQM